MPVIPTKISHPCLLKQIYDAHIYDTQISGTQLSDAQISIAQISVRTRRCMRRVSRMRRVGLSFTDIARRIHFVAAATAYLNEGVIHCIRSCDFVCVAHFAVTEFFVVLLALLFSHSLVQCTVLFEINAQSIDRSCFLTIRHLFHPHRPPGYI